MLNKFQILHNFNNGIVTKAIQQKITEIKHRLTANQTKVRTTVQRQALQNSLKLQSVTAEI